MEKRVALVTGAAKGIGNAITRRLARDGYDICINYHSRPEAAEELSSYIKSLGRDALTIKADMARLDEVRAMYDACLEHFGRLDLCVNNAGISHFGLLSDMSDEEWRTVMDTNLSSAFYCCREALPYMVTRKQGRIINISSMWGVAGASCEAAYSASKAGLNGLTQALAKELAPSNVQVNAIACGVIDTEMNARLDEEERNARREEIPAGRFGTPEEAAKLALMLAEAPGYLTGQIIRMDGGLI